MTKREWKYLRHQYRKRKGHFGIGYNSFKIDSFQPIDFNKPSSSYLDNFAMMIPLEAHKPYVEIKKQRTRSEERYFLPLPGYSTISKKGRTGQRIINL